MANDKIRVLFVDDDSLVLRSILRWYHGHERVQAIAATNAEAAWKLLDEAEIDIVVSDLRMPSIDGVELLEHCRRRHPQTARVILSAFVDRFALKRACATAQVDAVIAKPFDGHRTEAVLVGIGKRATAFPPRAAAPEGVTT